MFPTEHLHQNFIISNPIIFWKSDLTPNRADAASHIGVARDIKAIKKPGNKMAFR